GLTIAQRDIHDYPNNHTRFIVLTKNKDLIEINQEVVTEKTTLLITLPEDRAGVVNQVLSAFAWCKMSLSKIESGPMKKGVGNYIFIIVVNEHMVELLLCGVNKEFV